MASSNAKLRHLNINKWINIIRHLLNTFSEHITIYWGPNHIHNLDNIKNKIQSNRIQHLFNLTISQLFDSIQSCKYFISIDSGIGHIASIFNIPQIVE